MAFFSCFYTKASLLMGVLIVAYLLPIWLFTYFPTQDGVSHVYNSQILTEYNNPEYQFRDYYEINWYPFPNWLSHFFLAVLMFVFPALIAEKIFLSLYVILFPLAIYYFLNAVQRGRYALVILSFTFVYNYLFLMGFYNFAISVPLFFLALGYWWKHKDEMRRHRIILLNLLIVITYFAHLISYAFILFSIALLALFHFRRDFKRILVTGCYLLPAAMLLLVYLPTSDLLAGEPPEFGFGRVKELFANLIGMHILISYTEPPSWMSVAVSAFLIFLVGTTFWQNRKGTTAEHPGQKAFLCLTGVLLGLYFILPNSIGPGGWVNDRLAILASLAIFAWFREFDNRQWKRAFTSVVTLLALVNLVYVGVLFKNLNAEIRAFNAFVQRVEKNSVILPLHFDPRGSSERVGIFVNAANYYCLDNGCINLGNYEIQFDYFPVRFNADFETPLAEKEWVQVVHWQPERIDLCDYADNVDYLLLWDTPDEPIVAEAIAACYTLIASEGKLKLYKGQRTAR
ncbi:hypothetical protein C6503_26305 [Candidatus Poribacteria bacterium]|nr:MAG: hypothetical protein C6503_26305 [Candidatus Poribacteria bacterium]